MREKKEEERFVVWEENWDIVMMFLRMQTQWSVSTGGYVGMRYDVLLMQGGMMDLYSVKDRLKMLEGLQVMEAAALSEFAKQTEKQLNG